MKPSAAQQKEFDVIADIATRAGNYGPGCIENPKTQAEKRCRKLYDLGLVFYVGCGEEGENGFSGGVGLIPAEMFDPDKHTKLPLNWRRRSKA